MATHTQLQRQIIDEAQQLTPDEQLVLIQELLALYQQRVSSQPTHSLRELRGLGKETWRGIDPQEYIEEERNSWDG